MKTFPVKRRTKLEVVKAVQALEKRGYECVIPITEGKEDMTGRNKARSGAYSKCFINGTRSFWYTKMKPVDKHELSSM